jgi:hypothetical protein
MNLGQLKTQIYTDLTRSDQTSAVANAISSAIDYYSNERWWFLEHRATASLSSSVAFYTVPTNMKFPDSLLITLSGSRTPLSRVDYQEIDEHDDGKTFGQPSEWAYYQDNIRMYPVPDGAYTMTLSYHRELTAMPSASSSNAWTGVARDLIRHRAVREVRQSVLRDYDGASAAGALERESYQFLRSLHDRRISTGRIKKTDW